MTTKMPTTSSSHHRRYRTSGAGAAVAVDAPVLVRQHAATSATLQSRFVTTTLAFLAAVLLFSAPTHAVDTTPPTAVAQDITITLAADGTYTLDPANLDGGSSDDTTTAGNLLFSASQTSFSCSDVGPVSVTLTVEDEAGNNATDTATVTVQDDTAPSITPQSPGTKSLNSFGQVILSPSALASATTDACGIFSRSVQPNVFYCTDIGANDVTLIVLDSNFNAATSSDSVTIADTSAPTVTAVADFSLALNVSGLASIDAAQVTDTATDNCENVTLSIDVASFSCTDVGTPVTVTLTGTDDSANTDTDMVVITVVDDTGPTFTLTDAVTATLNTSGLYSLDLDALAVGLDDNCGVGGVSLSASQQTFACSDAGSSFNISITASDGSASTTKYTNVTVVDTEVPSITPQAPFNVALNDSGLATITDADVVSSSSDNCAVATTTLSRTAFSCSDIGTTYNITAVVTDASANQASVDVEATVVDNIAPLLFAVSSLDVTLNTSGLATIQQADVFINATDNCDGVTVALNFTELTCADVGASTLLVTATDTAGNTDTDTVAVTVADDEVPTLDAVAATTLQLDDAGAVSITASDVINSDSDNCAVTTRTLAQSAFACSDVGTADVLLTISDAQGNAATANVSVTVEDSVNPDLTTVGYHLLTLHATDGNATLAAGDITTGTSDNCAVLNQTLSQSLFECADLGNNTITTTTYDVNGNSNSSTTTVEVVDTAAPVLAVNATLVVDLDAAGAATIAAGDLVTSAVDNCGVASQVLNRTSFSCNDVGAAITVLVTATDASGNAATATSLITVRDVSAPVFTLKSAHQVYLNASGQAPLTAADVIVTQSDNCAVYSTTVSKSLFTCADAGTTQNIDVTVTDVNGQSDTQTVPVEIIDNMDPTAVTISGTTTLQLGAGGFVSITPATVDNGSYDNCAIGSLSAAPGVFTCDDLGNQTVTLVVFDDFFNVDAADASVTIVDTRNPTLTLDSSFSISLNASGLADFNTTEVVRSVGDNCITTTLSSSSQTFTCSDVGTQSVSVTATDGSGNQVTRTTSITVSDDTDPTLQSVDAYTLTLNSSGVAALDAADITYVGSDNCAITQVAVNQTAFTCDNTGNQTLSFTVTDAQGQSASMGFRVEVQDTTAPILVPAAPLTLSLSADQGIANITIANVTDSYSDNCAVAATSLSQDGFTCAHVGSHTISIVVTDSSGLQTTATTQVSVQDAAAPTFDINNTTVVLDANGDGSITSGDVSSSVTDNCGVASTIVSTTAFTCSNLGANTITVTVTDVNGNTNAKTATVNVQDTQIPVVNAQVFRIGLDLNATGYIELDTGSAIVSVVENCGYTTQLQKSLFTCDDVGDSTTLVLIEDEAGNTGNDTVLVRVDDMLNPVVTMQADFTVSLNSSGLYEFDTSDIVASYTDNCAINALVFSKNQVACSDVGTVVVTATATDTSGNTDAGTVTVTVEDNESPVVTAVASLEVFLNSSGEYEVSVGSTYDSVSDNCGADVTLSQSLFTCADLSGVTITLTATDPSSNTGTDTLAVTVTDNESPTLTVAGAFSVSLNSTGQYGLTTGEIVTSSADNCAVASVEADWDVFTCADTGAQTVTGTVTDTSGNTDSSTVTVTVEDNESPVVTAVASLEVFLNSSGEYEVSVGSTYDSVSDNCGADVTLSQSLFTCADLSGVTITLTATDPSSNTGTDTLAVTVTDNESPTLTVAGAFSVSLNSTGQYGLTTGEIVTSSADNCAVASVEADWDVFTCADTGAQTVTGTVTDTSGNTDSSTVTVTVEDNESPVVTAVASLEVFLNSSGEYEVSVGSTYDSVSDNCGADVTLSQSLFTCADLSGVTITLTATDPSSNTGTDTLAVTVTDNESPTVSSVANYTVVLDGNGNGVITSGSLSASSADNCAVASVDLDVDTFTCGNISSVIPVTVTATDTSGNTATSRTEKPNFVNTPFTVELGVDGTANALPFHNDTCGVADIITSLEVADCADVATSPHTVSVFVTDVNGQFRNGDVEVTVVDTLSPNVTTQSAVVTLDASGTGSLSASEVIASSEDNCAVSDSSVDRTSFGCADLNATQTVLVTVEDASGNTASGQASVTVVDVTSPVLSVAPSVNVVLNGSGVGVLTVGDVEVSSSDACGVDTRSLSQTVFGCAAALTSNEVTLVVADGSGNSANGTSTVVVQDNESPVVTAVASLEVFLNSSGEYEVSVGSTYDSVSDNCGADVTLSQSLFTCADLSGVTITLTATDPSSNTGTDTLAVTVTDNESPTLTVAGAFSVSLNSTGQYGLTTGEIVTSSADNCAVASVEADWDVFTCADTGAQTVTGTVTDTSGNTDSSTVTVTVEDNESPVVTAVASLEVFLNSSGEYEVSVGSTYDSVSDNCGADVTLSQSLFTCADLSGVTITLTATDPSSNTGTDTLAVTVTDNASPTVSSVANYTVVLDGNGNGVITSGSLSASSADNCAVASVDLDVDTFTCGNISSVIPVTVTATDTSGNTATSRTYVTVVDQDAPVMTTVSSITVEVGITGQAVLMANDVVVSSSDNCETVTFSLNQTLFDCDDVSTSPHVVLVTATDSNGLTATSEVSVTVVDSEKPNFVNTPFTVELGVDGTANALPFHNDTCGVADIITSLEVADCADVATSPHTVSVFVTDVNGQFRNGDVEVTVVDTLSPNVTTQSAVVTLDASGTGSLSASEVIASSEDNCAVSDSSVDRTSFGCADLNATQTVLVTVEDASGNTASGQASVTVIDVTSPVLSVAPSVNVVLNGSGVGVLTVGDVEVSSSDACGVDTRSLSQTVFGCAAALTSNEVTLVVADGSGNSANGTSTVVVQDNESPVVTAVASLEVFLNSSGEYEVSVGSTYDSVSDNCGADVTLSQSLFTCADLSGVTITLTATDPSSNTGTDTLAVTVTDNESPTLTVAGAFSVSLNSTGQYGLTTGEIVTSSADNCAVASVEADWDVFTCADTGAQTVTGTVTDTSGNTDSSTVTVTVEDNESPVVTAVASLEVFLNSSGEYEVSVGSTYDSVSDNCGADVTLSQSLFTCADLSGVTITLTATDPSSNTGTDTLAVTVTDSESPVITDFGSGTVMLNSTGASDVSFFANASDNCAVAASYAVPAFVTCADLGSVNVTLFASDSSSNVASVESSVLVLDTEAPVLSLLASTTVTLSAAGDVVLNHTDVVSSLTDNCAASLADVESSWTCSNVNQTNNLTIGAVDASGNFDYASMDVTVLDATAPVVSTQNVTLELDSSGMTSVTEADVVVSTADACGVSSVSLSVTSLTCSQASIPQTITVSATDGSGNVGTATAVVTAVDTISPEFSVVSSRVVQLGSAGFGTLSPSQVITSMSDNCQVSHANLSQTVFTCVDVQDDAHDIVVSVTDIHNNTATKVVQVYVRDPVDPELLAPDVVLDLDASGRATLDANTSDACGVVQEIVSKSVFKCADLGHEDVNLFVKDSNGNSYSGLIGVDVRDTIAPTFSVEPRYNVSLDASGSGSIDTATVILGADDNCEVVEQTLNQTDFTCADRGVNLLLATIMDVANLTTSHVTEVLVEDLLSPVLSVRPSLTVELNATGEAAVTVADLDLGTDDNCGISSLAISTDMYACADLGPQTLTFSATDTTGLVSTATVNITVEDNILPDVTVQDVTLVLNSTGQASVAPADAIASSSDNCGVVSTWIEPSSVDCSHLGTVPATVYLRDAAGNVQSASLTLTVEDNEAPVVSVVGSHSVTLDSNGAASVSVGTLITSSTDNCAVDVENVTQSAFSCSDVGPVPVTVSVYDVAGNSDSAAVTITVSDTLAPTLVTQDVTVSLNATGQRTFLPSEAISSLDDNCGIASTTANNTLFSCSDTGVKFVEIASTDVNGLTTTETVQVTVEDDTPPTVTAVAAYNLTLGANGLATLSVGDVLLTESDNCGISRRLLDMEVFGCSDVNQTHTVTLTVFDTSEQPASTTIEVRVLDSGLPDINTAPTTKVLNSGGHVSLQPSDVNSGSTDVCGVLGSSVSPSAFSCADVGVNVVTLTVTDVYGNANSAQENVTIVDQTEPTVGVLQGVTRTLSAAGTGTLAASNLDDSTSDACGIASLSVNQTALTCADVGTISVLFTAVDVNGNNASTVVDVAVVDSTAPSLSLTDVVVQLNSSGLASINRTLVDTGTTDACGIASFVLSDTEFSCATVGDNSVTVTVTDVNGNVATDTINVHVVDTLLPNVVTQPATLVLNGTTGTAELSADQVDGGSNDACGVVLTTVNQTLFTCEHAGVNTVNLTVHDAYGNTASDTALVTVNDETAPVVRASISQVTLNASGMAALLPTDVDAGSSDVCGVAQLSLDVTQLTCADVGVQNNTLYAADAAGNVGSLQVNYTVVDVTAPTVPLRAEYVVELNGTTGTHVFDAAALSENATDACGVSDAFVLPAQVTCSMVGQNNTATVYVDDVNGNRGSSNTSIVVLDRVAPVLALKTNYSFVLNETGVAVVDPTALDGSTFDACGFELSSNVSTVTCAQLTESVPVVVRATDPSGNSVNGTIYVGALDQTRPTLSVSPLSITLDADQSYTLSVDEVTATFADACGVVSQQLNQTEFTCADVGVQPVLYTVFDASGNKRTAVVDVTVLDSTSNPCPFAVDCVMSKWMDATPCSVSCGGHGTYLQNRSVLVQPENGGMECPAQRNRTLPCIRPACPRQKSFRVVGTYRFVEQTLDDWTPGMTQRLIDAVCNATNSFVDCGQVNVTSLRAGSVIAEVSVDAIAEEIDADEVRRVISDFDVDLPASFGSYSVTVEQETENVSSGSSALDSTWGTAGVSLFAVALVVLIVVSVIVYRRRARNAASKSRVTVTHGNAQAAWDALKRDLTKPKTRVRDQASLVQFADRRASQTISPRQPMTQRTQRTKPSFPRVKRNAVADMPDSSPQPQTQTHSLKRSTSDSRGPGSPLPGEGPRTAANLQMPTLPTSPAGRMDLPGQTTGGMAFPGSPVMQAPTSSKTQVPTFQKPNFGSEKRSKGSPLMQRKARGDPFGTLERGANMQGGGRTSPVLSPPPGVQGTMRQGPPPSLGFPVPPKPPTFADPFSEQRRTNMPPMMPGMPPPSLGAAGPRTNMPSFPARPGPKAGGGGGGGATMTMPGRPTPRQPQRKDGGGDNDGGDNNHGEESTA
ncbi:hypothetical protein PTSG_08193 [Salpingoeca rosetta]|uniref:Cadherin domain-containing protein n=1 Tax=Salpingoeca rosetta (strain ATCC 50818 / BSB-021) TaxID=946362 RepID=F2UI97_SALR5|nr:uncharacterized protein PTSG_08193 [Salpingoeca rosetta]EGD76846.1 hypothetical protein PTSG_08193 [Salpingoeca rosetta]|eukprot:XP_004991218.1 hypothetical protein PTSG_08193 [Salpingoeca rosetta]